MVRPLYGGVGCCFCLHRVLPAEEFSSIPDNHALEIAPEALRAMLQWVLSRGLEVISIDAVPERLARPTGRKFVCFVFDDGYRDNLVHALPIFREFQMLFAVSITNGFVEGNAPVWWYALERLLVQSEAVQFAWEGRKVKFPCPGRDERIVAFEAIAKMVRACSLQTRAALLAQIFPDDAMWRGSRLIMTWNEVRSMHNDPLVTICAHTLGHHTLNRLTEAEAFAELRDSKADLEDQLNTPVRHLAFPFGGRNAVGDREFLLARKAGFQMAFTTRGGNLFAAHQHFLDRLPRWSVSGNRDLFRLLSASDSGLPTACEYRGRRVVTD